MRVIRIEEEGSRTLERVTKRRTLRRSSWLVAKRAILSLFEGFLRVRETPRYAPDMVSPRLLACESEVNPLTALVCRLYCPAWVQLCVAQPTSDVAV